MKRNQALGALLGVIIIAGGAFYAGTAYGKGQTPAASARGAGAGFAGRTGGARGGAGGFTTGQILSVSGTSMTIQQQNGSSSEIVILSPSTQVLKTTTGSATDLTAGTNVVVTGTPNSDGSLTAQSVQIRPAGMNFPGAGGGRGGASGTPTTQTTGQ
jgi:hypothetical protein